MPRIPTAYKDLPTGWRWSRLDHACIGIYDCPHSTPKLTDTGPYLVRTQDMDTGVFRSERAAHVSNATYHERISRVRPRHGDLLYSREGSYHGIAAEVPADRLVCLGQRLVLIRPDPEILDHSFLRHWLNSTLMADYVRGFRDGSAAERLNLPTIRALPVAIPPLEDQRTMSSFLSTLEQKVGSNRRIADTALLMLDNMTMELGYDFPVTTLSELADVTRNSFSPSSLGDTPMDHFSIPFFDSDRLPERVPAASVMSAKLLITEPCILVSRLNPRTNRTWFANPVEGVVAGCSTEFLVLQPRANVTLGSLWMAVRDGFFVAELARRVTGTSGSHQRVGPADALSINVSDVRQLSSSHTDKANYLLKIAHQRTIESSRLIATGDSLSPQLLSGRTSLELSSAMSS